MTDHFSQHWLTRAVVTVHVHCVDFFSKKKKKLVFITKIRKFCISPIMIPLLSITGHQSSTGGRGARERHSSTCSDSAYLFFFLINNSARAFKFIMRLPSVLVLPVVLFQVNELRSHKSDFERDLRDCKAVIDRVRYSKHVAFFFNLID